MEKPSSWCDVKWELILSQHVGNGDLYKRNHRIIKVGKDVQDLGVQPQIIKIRQDLPFLNSGLPGPSLALGILQSSGASQLTMTDGKLWKELGHLFHHESLFNNSFF